MIDLQRHDQVVCLKDRWTARCGNYSGPLPIKQGVYTVAKVFQGRSDGDIYLNLVEFPTAGFTASSFRKVQNQSKFDFRKITKKVPEHAS